MAIRLSTFLLPKNDNNFFLLEDKHIKGGYTIVNTLVDRDNIPEINLKVGSLVYVISQNSTYRYDGLVDNVRQWTADFLESSSGSGTPVIIQSEGVDVGTGVASVINFSGPSVEVVEDTVTPGVFTITITGTAGGSATDETIYTYATVDGTETINANVYKNYVVNLNQNWTFTLTPIIVENQGYKHSVYLYLKQDSTGGRTITWPSSISWDVSQEPILTTSPNKMDIVYLETIDGGTTWIGSQIGGNI